MRVDLRAIAQAATYDPREALLSRIGPLTSDKVFHNYVLCATYIPSEMTSGGIIMPDRSLAEARFQGKVGLVLKCGPLAFKDDSLARFGGITVEPGDWVFFRPSDGFETFIRDITSARKDDGVSCRLIEDTLIKMQISDPTAYY